MAVRYLFNTSGQYVAFMSGSNVFDTNSEWIGFIVNGNEMHDIRGAFHGYILDDDRVAKRTSERKPAKMVPLRPLKPIRPFKPLMRLRMAPLPHGFIDVFEAQSSASSGKWVGFNRNSSAEFPNLTGTYIYAADGTFLGTVSKNRFELSSLTNEFGPHGSPYSPESIFNQFGNYGSPYATYSPFNPLSTNPPHFLDASGRYLGELSANQMIADRIDTSEFVSWLKS